MRMRPGLLSLFILLLLPNLFLASPPAANIVASITVPPSCVFGVSYNPSSVYGRVGTISTPYTLNTLSSCSISGMNGNFVLTQVNTNTVVFSNNLVANNIGFAQQTFNAIFGSQVLTNTVYSGTVTFTYNTFTASSTNSFTLLNPQNLTLSSLSVPSGLVQSSSITISLNSQNIGQLSSGASTLYINITGPTTLKLQYPESSLSPGQSSTYSISLNNATAAAGSYTVTAYETYTVNTLVTTNILTAHYTVSSSGTPVGGAGGGGAATSATTPITPIPALSFVSTPIYSSIQLGSQGLSPFTLQNSGNQPESIQFTVPKSFQNFVKLSTSSLYLLPNQQVSIQLFVTPNATMPSGTYILPLSVNLNAGGTSVNQTEYFTLNVYSPLNNSVKVINQVVLVNGSGAARGIIQVSNPTSKPLNNVTLQTLIPLALAQSISDITTTGLQANVTDPPGFYTITWQIPQISPSTAVFGYYTINRPQSIRLLSVIQNMLAQPSAQTPSSVLKVVNIAFPTFYTNSTNSINVFTLYTGSDPDQMTFTLTAPPGISISNASQTMTVNPNQLVSPRFDVKTSAAQGTYLLNLYISTADGFNYTYSLPLIALNNPQTPSSAITRLPSTSQITNILSELPFKGLGLIAIIVVAILLSLLRRHLSRPKYKKETSEQLVRLREQIKRSENE